MPRTGTIASVRKLAVVVLLALVALAGCGDDASDGEVADERVDAEVYAAIISWFADRQPPPTDAAEDALPVVFLDSLDDEIAIEVQVEVLAALEDELAVRFIDTDEEAIDDGLDGDPVRAEGLLLRLGPIVDRDGRMEVDVERYEGAEQDPARYRIVVESSGGVWRVVGEPEALPPPESSG